MRRIVVRVCAVLASVAVVAGAKPPPVPPCPDVRFLTAAALVAGGDPFTALVFDASGHASIPGLCVPAATTRERTRGGGVLVHAHWRTCGTLAKVKLATTLDAPACTNARGTFRAHRLRPVSFTAAPSTCGDGRVDPGSGEECDGATCVGGAPCAACRCGTTTSTTLPICTPLCGANAFCEGATLTCQCAAGFLLHGGVCEAAPQGHPSGHTLQEVCAQWTAGHVVTELAPLVATGMACDAGTLRAGAITDTLARLNLFRWLVGLGPSTADTALNANAQFCANLEAWWDFASGGSPHQPPSSAKCYTSQGGATAGRSNLAWGSGHPAPAIDQFMEDDGNVTTLGHRRWILNPPLDPVGIGYWETGGVYGNAMCLDIFGMAGTGPTQPWTSVPNAGFAPFVQTQWTWSFQSNTLAGTASASITMLRVDDDVPLPVNRQLLSQGYGEDAVSWTPNGWQPEVGRTYRVTVSGLAGGDVVYDVKPVICP